MRYRRLTGLLGLLLLALPSAAVIAQGYELSGKSYEMTWPKGKWNGKFGFPGVYCVTFPMPDKAERLTTAMFNRNAINLTRVVYPDRLAATIAISTVPAGRSAEQEVARMVTNEHMAEQAYRHDYHVTQFSTGFGPTIGLRINDVVPDSSNGPFPLARALFRPAPPALASMSVHRLFVRGPDRFEVAVIQLAPQPGAAITEAEMQARLTAFADDVVNSLQSCTAAMPVRGRK